jgi:hypothetical protein
LWEKVFSPDENPFDFDEATAAHMKLSKRAREMKRRRWLAAPRDDGRAKKHVLRGLGVIIARNRDLSYVTTAKSCLFPRPPRFARCVFGHALVVSCKLLYGCIGHARLSEQHHLACTPHRDQNRAPKQNSAAEIGLPRHSRQIVIAFFSQNMWRTPIFVHPVVFMKTGHVGRRLMFA